MIKNICDNDYNKLLELYQKYQSELYAKNNYFASSLLLNEELNKPNKLALGVYNTKDILVGFLLSYDNVLSSIYIEKQYRIYLAELINYFEDRLKEADYIGWETTSLTGASAKALEHLKAQVISIKYYKEI